MLNMFNHTQSPENLRIFAWTMYISIGKYTVKGQNAKAPIKPKISLKNGNNMATMEVATTYAVRHITLK